jgi:hypothetical protein
LIYAESYLLKALLCIIHDESFVAFLREGLHVRSSYNTYKALEKFLNHVRQEAMNGQDISEYELDDHFTSGIALGIGLFNIVVSLLPSAIIKVAQIIGFSSNRSYGLETLESTGGWEEFRELPPNDIPPLQEPNEGLRRQFCDMALLAYHIILSKLIPISDLNQELADRVLLYNLTLYPRGVFFLYFSGRQLSALSQLPEAKNQYQTAIDTQKDWKQLQHMCYWELGLINLLQQNWIEADNCYTTLLKESNWSKCVYTYLEAVSIYRIALSKESGSKDQKKLIKKANDTMQNVSSAKQKIAGKSIPLEKFVARKARKFLSQNNRLLFPDLEVLTAFGFFDFQSVELLHINLDRINVEIEKLSREKKHEEMLNYYDDICLCHYLRTMVLRLMITRIKGSDIELWKKLHKESTDFVKDNANRIQLDHYIYYFTQYEESRLYIIEKQFDSAQEIIDALVRSSEKHQFNIGAGPHAKNKYSLENILLFRCHSCTQEIKEISTSDSE